MIQCTPTVLDLPGFRISADAEAGGRITELFHHPLGRNLLAAGEPEACLTLEGGQSFAIAGWIEAFPSLEPCGEIPTLGHAWRTPAACVLRGQRLLSHWHIPGWRLVRTIRATSRTVTAEYTVANLNPDPAAMLWAAHVLFPLAGLAHAELRAGRLLPGPQCDLQALASHLEDVDNGWRIPAPRRCGRSWKFFLPAARAVVLHYDDATLTLSTTAPWWGIWLNLGAHQTACLGIEPTTAPTDSVSEVPTPLVGNGRHSIAWQLQIDLLGGMPA